MSKKLEQYNIIVRNEVTNLPISFEAEKNAYLDLAEAESLVHRSTELDDVALHELGSRLLLLQEVSYQPEIKEAYREQLNKLLGYCAFELNARSDEEYDVL